MMFTAFSAECDSSSRCSTASPSGDTLGYYASPAESYSSMSSPQSQDFTELTVSSASPFVPTVTAISSSADLQWLVQPVISSSSSSGAAPSHRCHPYAAGRSGASKRGKAEKVSPEEEEKRRVRRERNKQAAAKCRNRRRELTDTLQAETDKLEDQKSNLQNDIAVLLKEKERLEFILAAHQPVCKIPSESDSDFASPSSSSPSVSSSSPSSSSSSSAVVVVSSSQQTFLPHTSNSIFSGPPGLPASDSRMSELEASILEESLDLLARAELKAARSVPEVDLSGSFYSSQEWEPLHSSAAAADFEPLCTPVVTCTPAACTTYTSSMVFTFPDGEAFPTCGVAHRRGSGNSSEHSPDSLHSPTLLAL